MRILFITPYPPSPIRARSFGFIGQLARDHQVTLLCLCTSAREMGDVKNLVAQGIQVYAYQELRLLRYLRCILAMLSDATVPLQVLYAAAPTLREAVRKHLASNTFDLVHIEFIRALGLLPEKVSLPIVWDAVDCVSNLYALGAQHSTTPILKILGKRETRLVRDYERQQLYRFHHILVTAERERQALLSLLPPTPSQQATENAATITVLPLGIDTSYFQSIKGPRNANYLVFSGKMSFHANIAGALQLIKGVMPYVWQQHPDIRVIIAGSDPPPAIQNLAVEKRVEITGYVDDLRPYIAQAHIAVCPLPYAVGVQYKVLEAMALGTPVVASSHVAAGIQAAVGQDLLVADHPQEFAQQILRLLNDKILWQNVAEHALHYVQTHHNWELLMQRLLGVYQAALEEGE